MIKVLKNRRALSTVVTTLIILVVAVLLATVVTYYAINVVSTRVQEESLSVVKQHVWNNATGIIGSPSYALAALMVTNTGGRDVVINEIAVRGQACPWNNTASTPDKFIVYCTTENAVSNDLSYTPNFNFTGGINYVMVGTTQYNFTVATNPLILKSGDTMLVYIVNPDSISVNDVGLTVGITIHSAQAIYYRETNVEAVSSS
jgi:archaellin